VKYKGVGSVRGFIPLYTFTRPKHDEFCGIYFAPHTSFILLSLSNSLRFVLLL
jgi:hypothetical protein